MSWHVHMSLYVVPGLGWYLIWPHVCAYHNGVLQMLHGTRLPLCSNGVVCNHDVKHCSFFSGRAHGLYQFSCIVEILSPSCLCISACLADAPVLQRCILAVSRRVAACS
jgi:hypothetical protein